MMSEERGFNPFSIHQNQTSYGTLKANNRRCGSGGNATGSTGTLKCHSSVKPLFHFHLLADFSPGLLQAVDGAAVEGGRDLQHPVVIVEAAADVSHGHPLLYGAGPGAHVGVGHDLRRHQVAHLEEEKRRERRRGCGEQEGQDGVTGRPAWNLHH